MVTPLFEGNDWDYATLDRTLKVIEEIALQDLGLTVYPNQFEIVNAEQMLDAYASIGMPIFYRHWSYGKRFVREERLYRKGLQGLAYELVINSDPCVVYIMEGNSMALQAIVMAHAAFGHNHFFKNNYLFKLWTDADAILGYLKFARDFVSLCEEKYGIEAVEEILDAAHALADQGVFRYKRPAKVDLRQERKRREQERKEHEETTFRDIWRTIPKGNREVELSPEERKRRRRREELKLPEENLLYFIEKYSPILEEWQRELVRIVRNIAQYFYPQKQTKMLNEGCATFVHYYILEQMHKKGFITDGTWLEILHSHTNVIFQPDFDETRKISGKDPKTGEPIIREVPLYRGINPYALGFAMMQDIVRIATEPTAEDREWFGDKQFVGCGDWRFVLKNAWENYRDESFIMQFLSPTLIRKFKLFSILDDEEEDSGNLIVRAIHNEEGYRIIRDTLSAMYDIGVHDPEIQVANVDLRGDRTLHLRHRVSNRRYLEEVPRNATMAYIRRLWGHNVVLTGVDRESERRLYELDYAQDIAEDDEDEE